VADYQGGLKGCLTSLNLAHPVLVVPHLIDRELLT
jgi:hypothetical protein